MLFGVFFGFFLSVFVSSLLLLVFNLSGLVVSVPVTGAVLGSISSVGSVGAVLGLLLFSFLSSFVVLFFLVSSRFNRGLVEEF